MINSDLNINENSKSDRSERRGSERNSDRIDRRSSDRGDRRDRGDSSSRRDRFAGGESTTRLFINLGKKDNLRYDEMRELIFQHSKVSGHNIKDIDMGGVFSFFETDAKSAERILDGFKNVDHNGREVRIDKADGQGGQGGGAGSRSFKPKPFSDRVRSNEGRASEGGSSFGDRKKRTFTSSKPSSSSSDRSSKPRFKKKDDMSW
jgi:ATP-dependent RNA helicase DeaD